jgi:hypothetical protein
MELDRVLDLLVDLAERTGMEVRFVQFDPRFVTGPGGVCKMSERDVIMVDRRALLADQVAIITRALSRRGVRAMFVPQLLRRRVPASP